MRTLLSFVFGLSCGLAFVACSADESAGRGSQSDASTTGGVTATGGKSSGGAAGTGGASSGGRSGTSGAGGTSGTGGSANGGAGASGTGGSTGADAGADGDAGTGGDAGLARTSTWDFTSDAEGWTGGFADYPSGEETFYELAFAQSAMPAEVGPGGGLKSAGNNHSDDLFMFVTKEITGLAANTSYVVSIDARIATNAPGDCSGIGGSPGTSVFFKMGAVAKAPVSAPGGPDGSLTMQMNLDKGNQGSGGADMQVSGDIANTKLCPDETYQLKTLSLTGFSVTSDASGRLWIVLGTDSGFEGTTVLYYDRVTVTIRQT
jgi:hypothetical protein